MAISFRNKNGMDVEEGAAGPRDKRAGCTGCRGFNGCKNREGGQLFSLQKALEPPCGLTVFRVPVKKNSVAGGPGYETLDAVGWANHVNSLLLDGDFLQRLFSIKGFFRMAWLQGDEALLQSRRLMGALKQKKDNGLWHPNLHSHPLPAEIAEIDAWGSQVWFDLERPESPEDPEHLVIAVRNRRLDGRSTLADDVKDVVAKHCRDFLAPQQLQRHDLSFGPLAAGKTAGYAEIAVPFTLGSFVIGMNFDEKGETGIRIPTGSFPRNRVQQRRVGGQALALKAVLPALRGSESSALPISSLRGPLREAMRWSGWLAGLGQYPQDPSRGICGWVPAEGNDDGHATRFTLCFDRGRSALELAQGDFQRAMFYFTNDLFKGMVNPERPRNSFNPMQVVYHPGLSDRLVLRVRDASGADLAMIRKALELVQLGFFRVGRFRSRGFGRMTLGDAEVTRVVAPLSDWLRDPQNPNFTSREVWSFPTVRSLCQTPPPAAPAKAVAAPEKQAAAPAKQAPAPPQVAGRPFDFAEIPDEAMRQALCAEERNLGPSCVLYCVEKADGNSTRGRAVVKKDGRLYTAEEWKWDKPQSIAAQPGDWFVGIVNGTVDGSKALTKKGCRKIEIRK